MRHRQRQQKMRFPVSEQVGEVDDDVAEQQQQKQECEQQEHHPLDQHRPQAGEARGELQSLVKQRVRQ